MWKKFWDGFFLTFAYCFVPLVGLGVLLTLIFATVSLIMNIPIIGYTGAVLVGLSIIGGVYSAIIGTIEDRRLTKEFEKRAANE